jgi:hypothetical protein
MAIFMKSEPEKKWVNGAGTYLVSIYLIVVILGGMLLLATQLGSLTQDGPAQATGPASPALPAATDQAAATTPSTAEPIPRQPAVVQAAQSDQTEGAVTGQAPEATGQSPEASSQPEGEGSDTAETPRPESRPQTPEDIALTATFAAIGGSLGGSLHALRSLWWYAGHRQLVASWLPMYLLLPFGSALLATVVCLVLGAGFWDSGPATDSVGQILAVAALVGLFSDRAARMLEKVADVVFATKEKGADHQAAESASMLTISVAQTPTAASAAQPLTIKGAGFTPPVAVWLTDPGGSVTILPAQATPGATDSYDVSAVLAAPGQWTVRLTDTNGKASADLPLEVLQ